MSLGETMRWLLKGEEGAGLQRKVCPHRRRVAESLADLHDKDVCRTSVQVAAAAAVHGHSKLITF